VVEGDPLEEILRAADRYDIGAIATSSRGIGGVLRWFAMVCAQFDPRDFAA